VTAWTKEHWRAKRVTVAGLGTFGGQVAAAKFFAALGAKVTVTDRKPESALGESMSELRALDMRFVLGGHDEGDFANADLVVASPAIPESSPYLAAAEKAGVPITHEMDIFFQVSRAPIIAVTGSNGKSTTAGLLGQILDRCLSGGRGGSSIRKVWLGGNIGRSLLPDAAAIEADDLVVLELSSFQLEDLGALRLSPHGAVVTNLTPNHLDRHVTFANYAAAKRNITLWQKAGDFLVLNADDPNLSGWEKTAARVAYFGNFAAGKSDGVYVSAKSLVSIADGRQTTVRVPKGWKLMGAHNLSNLAAACAAAREAGVALADATAAAEDFKPLPHRLEYVATANGVRFYNDSIATTPESAEVALDSFAGPIVLIAGGSDKGVDLSRFARKAGLRVKALVAIGKTADAIVDEARGARSDLAVIRAGGLEEAVRSAYEAAAPGDVVLLSPACASYDMFNNFEERGDLFRAYARKLAGAKENVH